MPRNNSRVRIGLHGKFVLLLLSFGLSFGVVFFVFVMRGSINAYQNEFYRQVGEVFASQEFSESLLSAADDSPERVSEVIAAYAGQLGIDNNNRIYYILDGRLGHPLAAMNEIPGSVRITSNILAALNGREGRSSLLTDAYMDLAVPVGGYVVYLIDNKALVRSQIAQTGRILLQSVSAGLLISLFLAFIASRQIVRPLHKLTKVTIDLTSGFFPEPVEVIGADETAVLTERFNNMLEHLQASEQIRREFIANVSHELRTPITNIRSYAETLVEAADDIDSDARFDFLNVILSESDRMTKLVQDLLILSKIDAGEIGLEQQTYDFPESIRTVFDAYSLDAGKRGLNMALDIKIESFKLYADKDRIEQVLLNILSNAIRYTPDGGMVTVSCGYDDRNVWFSVSDTGIGIPKEDVPKLFDRFYRVDKARSRLKGGSGLGLSIAREIIDQHNGSIEVQSEEGVGTVVTVRIPQRQ